MARTVPGECGNNMEFIPSGVQDAGGPEKAARARWKTLSGPVTRVPGDRLQHPHVRINLDRRNRGATVKNAALLGLLFALVISLGDAESKQIQVKDAKGNTVTIEESKSFAGCVRNSIKLGHTRAQGERYCEQYFARPAGSMTGPVCGDNNCGRQPTVEACVQCSREHRKPQWTEAGMLSACRRIVPACHQAMGKKP